MADIKAIPSTSAELAEALSDMDNVTKLVNSGEFPKFMQAYVTKQVEDAVDLKAQITEQTQLAVAEIMGEDKVTDRVKRLNQTALTNRGKGDSRIYNAKAVGAKMDGTFEDFGDIVRANWHMGYKNKDRTELQNRLGKAQEIINSYGSVVPADGGFLIPEAMRAEILSHSLEKSVVRPLATVIPMESLTVSIPAIDDTSHATNVFGGVQAYWSEENAAITESQAAFRRIKLEAEKLALYSEIPNELMADATALSSFLGQRLPEALAWFEDDAFIDGSGAGEPLGFLNGSAVVAVAKETGQAADTILWENVVKMYSRMLPTSHGRAVWIASHDTFPELATMALSVGTGGSAVWLNNGVAGPPMTILGRPVIFTEKAEKLGDQGDLNYVDLSMYLIGDRQSMSVDVSPHFKFQNDVTAVRLIQRVAGRPWVQSALTPRNGSASTLSPFVTIAERA